MRLLLSVFIFLFAAEMFGQNLFWTPPRDLEQGTAAVGIETELSVNSTALNNRFMAGFIDGRKLSDDDVQSMMNRAGTNNRWGGDFNSRAYAAISVDGIFGDEGKSTALSFEFTDRTHFNAEFPREFMDVALNGNRAYAGQEANWDGLNFEVMQYKQIKTGLHQRYRNNKKWGISLGLNLGNRAVNGSAPYSRLYTSSNGDELRFNSTAEIQFSDSTNTEYWEVDGHGASVDLYHEVDFYLTDNLNEKGTFRVMVNDLGFIRWNEQSSQIRSDTLFYYRGTSVGTFPERGASHSAFSPDSVINVLTEQSEQGSYYRMLPALLRVSLSQNFSNYKMLTGLDYRFNANFKPYAYLHLQRMIGNRFNVGIIAGAGGYGTANAGLSLSYIHSGWRISAISQNLEGVMVPSRSGGSHGFLSVSRLF